MEALKNYGEMWARDLLAKDPAAIVCALLLLVCGSLLTSMGTKLGGRGVWSLAKLAWSGTKWLTTPKPPSDLAAVIMAEIAKHAPRDDHGHTIWYGQRLHFYGNVAYVDQTRVDELLTGAERRRILRSVGHARRQFAEWKVRELAAQA